MIKIKQKDIDNIIKEIGKISFETISQKQLNIEQQSPLYPILEPLYQLIDSKNKVIEQLLKTEQQIEEKIQTEKLIFEIASLFPETYEESLLKEKLIILIKKISSFLTAQTGFFVKKNEKGFEIFVNHTNPKYKFNETFFDLNQFSFFEEIENSQIILKKDCTCPIFNKNFKTTLFLNFNNDIFTGFFVFCFENNFQLNEKNKNFLDTIKSILTILLMKFFSYKKTEAKKQEFEEMMDATESLGVIITDATGIITKFNKGASKMLGYKESEVVGFYTPEFFHIDSELRKRKYELNMEFGRTIAKNNVLLFKPLFINTPEKYIYTLKHKNKSKIFVEESIFSIKNFEHKIIGFLFIISDITSVKQSFKELQKSLNYLEESHQKMIEREMEIINLKKEINNELKLIGKEKKYLKTMEDF